MQASPPDLYSLLRAIMDTGEVFAKAATLRHGFLRPSSLLDWVFGDTMGGVIQTASEFLEALNRQAAWYGV